LAKAEAQLKSVDIDGADNNALIVNAALLRSYDSVHNFDSLSPAALSKLTSMSGAELDAWLVDLDGQLAFNAILADSNSLNTIAANSSAMATLVASQSAMNAVVALSSAVTSLVSISNSRNAILAATLARDTFASNVVAMAAIVDVPTALNAFLANSSATDVIAGNADVMEFLVASTTARNAMYASTTAINSIIANSVSVDAFLLDTTPRGEVLNTESVRNSFFGNATAAALVISNTNAMADIAASATLMNAVIDSSTMMQALKSNATAHATFSASTALTANQITHMTGDESPAPFVVTYSSMTSYTGQRAFDDNTSTYWRPSSSTSGNWIAYDFSIPVSVHKLSICQQHSSYYMKSFELQYSDNGYSWTTADTLTGLTPLYGPTEFKVGGVGKHRYWRINILTGNHPTYQVYLHDLDFIGFQ